MRSAYFKEQKRYTKQEIAAALGTSVEETTLLLRRLKNYGAVKAVRANPEQKEKLEFDAPDETLADVDSALTGQLFLFRFVGVLTVGRYLFKCYPKYITHTAKPLGEMKQILRVLQKYNAQEQIISMANGADDQNPFNLLAILLFLVRDYLANGAYSNRRDVLEVNGDGEIEWDRTINDAVALLQANRPYYFDLYTRSTIDDTGDFISRVHRSVISCCSKRLCSAELSGLFDIEEVRPTEETLEELGDDDYLLYRLNQEMNVQFVTRKLMLLKTLYAFIAQRKLLSDGLGLSMYGTNSFNLVWEKVCAQVFGSHLNTRLKDLPVPLTGCYAGMPNATLLELIEKPRWIACSNHAEYPHSAKDTLTPDFITIYPVPNGLCFGIFDAKYYIITLNAAGVSGQPGVGDVTKQSLYQLAYMDFIRVHHFSMVVNAFLFPTDGAVPERLGSAQMDMLHSGLGTALEDIQVIKLPAQAMLAWYLDGTVVDIHNLLTGLS